MEALTHLLETQLQILDADLGNDTLSSASEKFWDSPSDMYVSGKSTLHESLHSIDPYGHRHGLLQMWEGYCK